MSFLNAEWKKLVLINYIIDPSLLQHYLPKGTVLDFYNGKCYISLVGFMFKNTKVLGIKIPGHVNFEEVNLRFYVKRTVANETRRGVVFIKEIVPKPAITFIANTVYKEHYETLPMKHSWQELKDQIQVSYQWKKDKFWQGLTITANTPAIKIPPNSETEFITEHYWGYAKVSDHKTNEYEVTHPKWLAYPIEKYELDVDFGLTYGSEFSFLNQQKPASVMLAEGSEITVENKTSFQEQQ